MYNFADGAGKVGRVKTIQYYSYIHDCIAEPHS